jgi:hypothetical protein
MHKKLASGLLKFQYFRTIRRSVLVTGLRGEKNIYEYSRCNKKNRTAPREKNYLKVKSLTQMVKI